MASNGSISTGFRRLHGAEGVLLPRAPPRPRIVKSYQAMALLSLNYVEGENKSQFRSSQVKGGWDRSTIDNDNDKDKDNIAICQSDRHRHITNDTYLAGQRFLSLFFFLFSL